LKRLLHANVVEYYGFSIENSVISIVLEYIENGSLLALLKTFSSTLPESLVVNYCSQVLEGLAYIHSLDVLHGDIKASNILVQKDGKVYFCFL
jgi:serine/threonine protein kinase